VAKQAFADLPSCCVIGPSSRRRRLRV